MEALAGVNVPPRAQALRGILLELERLANHTGDLGALAGDAAFLPTAAFNGGLRGEFLNMTALVCGNRFGRNMLKPGGVNFDLDAALIKELKLRLADTYRDVETVVALLWETGSVTDRFEETGVVPKAAAEGIGLVGPAARASGVGMDTRRNFPSGPYEGFTMSVSGSGDVYSRAYVRWLEIQKSAELVANWLDSLPAGPLAADCGPLRPGSAAVSLVEGWRGQICHFALTGPEGKFRHYKIVDPSFHNWQGLALALRNGDISAGTVPGLDLGRCVFCGACAAAAPEAVEFTRDYKVCASSRGDLTVAGRDYQRAAALGEELRGMFGRSFRLRLVSAGGCGACEADCNVLQTPAWDLGRFGIQFVASPRHADGLLVTGPVSKNMELALRKTYDAMPAPKVVIACGACAIGGGPYAGH